MGGGVIIRVGDRTSVFDSAGTRFLGHVAAEMAERDTRYKYQRALMSGGTCEATAYQEFGYRSAAVCVALGNYHNCASDGTIQAEYVSFADAESMARLLEKCAVEFKDFKRITQKLPKRLAVSARQAAKALRKTALRVV
jgi:endoglucanase